jgi:hypothetical protein
MKNLFPVLLSVTGIIASGLAFAIYRKDQEIEKNCNCKKSNLQSGGNGNNPGNGRISEIQFNGMGKVNAGQGGGRSASDVEFVRPRGVAVLTVNGANVGNSVLHDNRKFNFNPSRMDQKAMIKRANLETRSLIHVN